MTEPRQARRLVVDIETSPNVAHVWSLYNVNVGLAQLIEPSRVICWAAQWVGESRVTVRDVRAGREPMLSELHDLLTQADIVIGYNSIRFDVPRIATEFALEGMDQPAPFAQVDLLRVVRRQFSFPTNKLAYVAPALGVGEKLGHTGHELWVRCMEGDAKAWNLMRRYNRQDVLVTTALYERLLPVIHNHPPVLLFAGEACNRCGSTEFTDGTKPYSTPSGSLYPQLRCVGCGGWSRTAKRDAGSTLRGVS